MTVLPWVTVVLVAVGIGLVDSEGDFVLMCPEQSDLRNCIGEVLTGIPRGRFQNGWVACEVRECRNVPRQCRCSANCIFRIASSKAFRPIFYHPPNECWRMWPRCENWGIARLSHEEMVYQPKTYYHYENDTDVDIYILDTGIRLDHEEFEGRAQWCYTTAFPLESDKDFSDANTDNHGHGTHVAGTAIGRVYGSGKRAKAISIKVLNHQGYGFLWDVLYGISKAFWRIWLTGRRAVINMSLIAEEPVPFMEEILYILYHYYNVPTVVAAGSFNRPACMFAPAGLGGLNKTVITVAATDRDDYLVYRSNYGVCVDLLAPGQCIRAAYHTCKTCYRTLHGSSSSAAFVSGILARYIAVNPSVQGDDLKQWVLDSAVPDKISIPNWKSQTPNLLAQSECYRTCDGTVINSYNGNGA